MYCSGALGQSDDPLVVTCSFIIPPVCRVADRDNLSQLIGHFVYYRSLFLMRKRYSLYLKRTLYILK